MSVHGQPASREVVTPVVVRVLAERPELRGMFPIADVVDEQARWSA